MKTNNNPWQVVRTIYFTPSAEPHGEVDIGDTKSRAVHLLKSLTGVDEVLHVSSNETIKIKISYDQRKIDLRTILQALTSSETNPVNTLWQRIRNGFYQYLDSNSRDIANTRPSPCCSNPTEILNKNIKKRR